MVIALVVTPDGLPMAYEVMAGNTNDSRTLRDFLAHIEWLYGKACRVWLMGLRYSNRSGAGGDARRRSASAISGGHTEGSPDPAVKSLPIPTPFRVQY